MTTLTFTIAIFWLILDAMLLCTDLEQALGLALSDEKQAVTTGFLVAPCLLERPPPKPLVISRRELGKNHVNLKQQRPEAAMLEAVFLMTPPAA